MTEASDAAWSSSPWGMAAIGDDGRVMAVNPAFADCSGIPPSSALGMSEATLSARLRELPIELQRIESIRPGVRAIHYLRRISAGEQSDQWLAPLVEALRESLASIYGFAELLQTQHYDEATRRDLTATLLAQADVMSNLINQQLAPGRHPPDSAPRQEMPGVNE